MVKQNQGQAGNDLVLHGVGVCAGRSPHFPEPQGSLQGKWFSLLLFSFS